MINTTRLFNILDRKLGVSKADIQGNGSTLKIVLARHIIVSYMDQQHYPNEDIMKVLNIVDRSSLCYHRGEQYKRRYTIPSKFEVTFTDIMHNLKINRTLPLFSSKEKKIRRDRIAKILQNQKIIIDKLDELLNIPQ